MKKAIHWIAHKMGTNTGQVETWWQDKRLMIGFRCDGCGSIEHVHESYVTLPPEALGLPAYPTSDVVGACVCGSWPGGECLRCPTVRVGEYSV